MSNTTFIHFIYHNQFCKGFVVLFYDEDNIDVGYN